MKDTKHTEMTFATDAGAAVVVAIVFRVFGVFRGSSRKGPPDAIAKCHDGAGACRYVAAKFHSRSADEPDD